MMRTLMPSCVWVWAAASLIPALLPSPLLAEGDSVAPRAGQPPAELDHYLQRPEPDFDWKLTDQRQLDQGQVFELQLTSQRWQEILWQHVLMVYEPAEVAHDSQMLLFVTGGSQTRRPSDGDMAMGLALAQMAGARVATLHQVPNQPLMDGRVEDDLITETWLRFLDSGDATWPLLFPMVKSAVKAMDALQQFAEQRQWAVPEGFVVTGASKRGWTSWLTAAADSRIRAAAPMVIDMLNFPAQIRHQYALWGEPSEQVIDYTSKGLIPRDGNPRPGLEEQLWKMMDPYNYRQRVQVPKLLIVGANDRYWATDAMNLYWEDLPGDKYIFRGANAGHSLDGRRDEAMATLAAFFQHIALDQPLPQLHWKPQLGEQRIGLEVQADQQPHETRFWVARSASKDFRESRWQSRPMRRNDGAWVAEERLEGQGHVAVFAEFIYRLDGLPYALATLAYFR